MVLHREHHCFFTIENHPILQMVTHGVGEDAAFDVAALADEVIRRVGMADSLDILLDDRALIEVRGDEMRGGADEFDATAMRLVIGFCTLEAGQKGMVNVNAFARLRTGSQTELSLTTDPRLDILLNRAVLFKDLPEVLG